MAFALGRICADQGDSFDHQINVGQRPAAQRRSWETGEDMIPRGPQGPVFREVLALSDLSWG